VQPGCRVFHGMLLKIRENGCQRASQDRLWAPSGGASGCACGKSFGRLPGCRKDWVNEAGASRSIPSPAVSAADACDALKAMTVTTRRVGWGEKGGKADRPRAGLTGVARVLSRVIDRRQSFDEPRAEGIRCRTA
jgi:hypothetical protein